MCSLRPVQLLLVKRIAFIQSNLDSTLGNQRVFTKTLISENHGLHLAISPTDISVAQKPIISPWTG